MAKTTTQTSYEQQEFSEIRLRKDGTQVLVDAERQFSSREIQDKIVKIEERRSTTTEGVSLRYETLQPRERTVAVYECQYYEAKRKRSVLGKLVVGAGMFGVVTFFCGVAGWILARSDDYATVAGLGGSLTSVMAFVFVLMEMNAAYDDYQRGTHIGKGEERSVNPWRNAGDQRCEPTGQSALKKA